MATAVLKSGLPAPDYYAPNYRVEIEGQELDPTAKGDVLEVKVSMEIDNLTSFDLTFNNWDDRTLFFKYSDTNKLDVNRRVHIQMGYAGRLVSMVRGMITSLTPRFPDSGSPTINVSGQDLLFRLKNSKPRDTDKPQFLKKADWQIAEAVATRNNLKSEVTKEGPVHDEVLQKNQDDAQFLMERAKRIDFDLFMKTDPKTGDDVLHFIKPTDGRGGQPISVYQFAYGQTLIDFSPTLSTSAQVSKLTVRGWDPRTKQPITYTADSSAIDSGGAPGKTGPAAVADTGGGSKQDRVVDAPVISVDEAKHLAESLLREKAYEFITGNGRIIGLAELRPGDNLQLDGLGKRFSGRYFVKKVTHAIGGSGFSTQFEVRKFADGGTV
jgi:phage protein D